MHLRNASALAQGARRDWLSPGIGGRRCLIRMGLEKELQCTPSNHAPVGFESRLPLQSIEVAIELRHEGQWQPYIDNSRRVPFWATEPTLRRRCVLGWGSLLGLGCHRVAFCWGHPIYLLCEESCTI
jgi:hypothetical protein